MNEDAKSRSEGKQPKSNRPFNEQPGECDHASGEADSLAWIRAEYLARGIEISSAEEKEIFQNLADLFDLLDELDRADSGTTTRQKD